MKWAAWLSKPLKRLVGISTSESPSQVNTRSVELGPKLTEVLQLAYDKGFTTSSVVAREHAAHIAMAASMGLISTQINEDTYGNRWRITVSGLKYLSKGWQP